MSEIFHRNDAVLAEVDTRRREITLLTVPWDQEAEVPWRGEVWNEVFRRGAFDGLEDSIGRVSVNREHVKGDTVGRAIYADPKAEDGLITRTKIARTARGEDTLGLAEDRALSPSVGYFTKEPEHLNLNRRGMKREVLKAFLDHISLVETPAFAGAAILDVREDRTLDEEPPAFVATLNDAWNDPEYLRALERLGRSRVGID